MKTMFFANDSFRLDFSSVCRADSRLEQRWMDANALSTTRSTMKNLWFHFGRSFDIIFCVQWFFLLSAQWNAHEYWTCDASCPSSLPYPLSLSLLSSSLFLSPFLSPPPSSVSSLTQLALSIHADSFISNTKRVEYSNLYFSHHSLASTRFFRQCVMLRVLRRECRCTRQKVLIWKHQCSLVQHIQQIQPLAVGGGFSFFSVVMFVPKNLYWQRSSSHWSIFSSLDSVVNGYLPVAPSSEWTLAKSHRHHCFGTYEWLRHYGAHHISIEHTSDAWLHLPTNRKIRKRKS